MDCEWKDCKKIGIYKLDGKAYCDNHYGKALHKAHEERMKEMDKPVGRAGMGASTVVINDSAGI